MRFRRGFSLLELLIAIVIILIIGKMAIPRLMDAIPDSICRDRGAAGSSAGDAD
ncbi:MAG: prepilin-type N-terminal cleavage/methylation domain-containing protein [Bryobacteraceae bacterium]